PAIHRRMLWAGLRLALRGRRSSATLRPCYALNCLAARGGRVDTLDDAQAGPRKAAGRRRATALIRHLAAGSPRRHLPAAASPEECRGELLSSARGAGSVCCWGLCFQAAAFIRTL